MLIYAFSKLRFCRPKILLFTHAIRTHLQIWKKQVGNTLLFNCKLTHLFYTVFAFGDSESGVWKLPIENSPI